MTCGPPPSSWPGLTRPSASTGNGVPIEGDGRTVDLPPGTLRAIMQQLGRVCRRSGGSTCALCLACRVAGGTGRRHRHLRRCAGNGFSSRHADRSLRQSFSTCYCIGPRGTGRQALIAGLSTDNSWAMSDRMLTKWQRPARMRSCWHGTGSLLGGIEHQMAGLTERPRINVICQAINPL